MIRGEFDETAGVPAVASRKRRALAVYIDFMLLGVVVGLVEAAAGGPVLARLGILRPLILLVVGEAIAHSLKTATPGYRLLGISLSSRSDGSGEQQIPVVDPWLQRREAWYTMGLALLFLNDGLKSAIRWSMWNTSGPYFGSMLEGPPYAALSVLFGVWSCLVAYYLFRMDRKALPLGIVYLGMSITSAVMSWNLWDSWVAEVTVRRREWQGLAVRAGDVEFMQSVLPEFAVVWLVLYGAVLLFAARRLPKAAA